MKSTLKNLLLFCIFMSAIQGAFGQIYVNSLSTGNNDGTSWTNAYTDLKVALDAANNGIEIWVATGTYLPSLSDRNASFQIPNGVRVLGGFPNSGNPSLADRDWQSNPTLLSGDIDGDGTSFGNSYTIVYVQNATSPTLLDGFIVQDGNANDVSAGIRGSYGGGLLNYADVSRTSHIEIRNSIFQTNGGINGGAIGNYSNAFDSKASIKVVNTQFLNNTATSQGGAIYNNGSQSASFEGIFIDCEFSNNLAQTDGGAICSNASGNGLVELTMEGCQFLSNRTTTGSGGGIYHISNADGTVNCTITNSKFDDNRCGQYGGGISAFNSDGKTVTTLITNSIFTDNFSKAGGGIYSLGAGRGTVDYTIVNSVFYKNDANIGGAIYFNEQNFSSSNTIATVQGHFYNSIFKNNTAIDFDPLFHFSGTPDMYLQNCLMYDVRNCDDKILGSGDAICLGGMIFFQDPLFANEDAEDFHLLPGSPALDAGDNSLVPADLNLDLEGNPRILNGLVDMGVYERSFANADTDNDGILDANDNCPLAANANQTDLDNDGAGAACDCDDSPVTGSSCRNGCIIFYLDQDGDGFGAVGTNVTACIAPVGYVTNNLDCNDSDDTIHPSAMEACDGIDNNCNGQRDEGTDDDNDGVCNENDICPNGDDTIDTNNNGIPDDCESAIAINCSEDIQLIAGLGQNQIAVNWQEPTATTDCTTGGGSSTGGDCSATSITGLNFIGSLNGSNFFLSQEQKIWTKAQAEAVTLNGHLAVINDAAENQLIKDAIGGKIVHIGLQYDPNTGTSSWVTGEALSYDNYEANTSSSTVNRFGIMNFWSGKWAFHGDYSKFYVIEIPCSGGGGGESSDVQIQQTAGLANGANFPIGTTTITYEATDDCGGTALCSFDVIVEPSMSSVSMTCPTNINVTTLPGATLAEASWSDPIAESDCPAGPITTNLTTNLESGSSFPIGTTVVAYEAADDCGGRTTCSFEVTVASGISSLSISCPEALTATALPGAASTAVTWSDPTVETDCTIGNSILNITTGQASGDLFPIGTSEIIYEVMDGCGSTTTCSFEVIVTSGASTLSLTCPTDIEVTTLPGVESTSVTWEDPTAQTDCTVGSPLFNITTGQASGDLFPVGTTVVTYEVEDGCSSNATCSFKVKVINEASTLSFTCPSNINTTAIPGAESTAVTWTDPTAQTDCTVGSPTINITTGKISGDLFPIGTNTVTYEVTDDCGSTATCSFDITVTSGASSLSLTCPSDASATALPGETATAVEWLDPTAQTDCTTGSPVLSITTGQASGDLFSIGTTTVTYEATDDCGSIATCSFNVTVTNSSSNISITCPADITKTAVPGSHSALISWAEPLSQSDCIFGIHTPTVISGKSSGELFPVGTTVVTYEVSDSCGNNMTCSFEVTVIGVDNELSLDCPSDITIDAVASTTTSIATWTEPVPVSNCPVSPNLALMTPLASGDAFPLGASTVRYETVDPCGGFATCSFLVTVNSTEVGDLTITCPSDVTITVASGASGGVATWATPTANSSCTTETETGGSTDCVADPISGFDYIGEFDGQHYYLSTSALSWPKAQAACEAEGGHLAIIENQAENDFIFSAINDVVHIGLSDKDTEGTFTWVDGSPLQYDNTQSFTANSSRDDYVVMYNWQPGSWGYVSSNVWKKYVLEIPCSGGGGNSNSGGPNITINQTSGGVSGSTFPVGQTSINYQATDACGNTATCNFIVEVIEQVVTCSEDTNGGTIGGEETNCGSYTPSPISSSSLPSGGQGEIEYVWLASTVGCPTGIGEQLPGAQGASLPVDYITQTTYYVRWSRRAGCIDWLASNCITKTVEDCGGPVATDYCESAGTQPWQEWIGAVQLESINNTSGKSSAGYDDFTDISTSLIGGQSYEVGVQPAFSWTQWNENLYVWIDFNQDNDFSDAGELVLNTVYRKGRPSSTPDFVTNTFQVPTTALNGTTRMRVAMKRDGTIDACETFQRGEVEDYSIVISGATDRSSSINFEEDLPKFLIYPNPATDIISVKFDNVIEGSSIQVINTFGQVLEIYDNFRDKSVDISVENYSSGLYYIRYSTPVTPVATKSFVVDKGY